MRRPAQPPEARPQQRLLVDQANEEMYRRRMTRNELGRRTGIHPSTLLRVFNCTRDMTVEQWAAISGALDLTDSRPVDAVAWLATPHLAEGLEQVTRGLTRMYGDKHLTVGGGEGGYWVRRREGR